MTRKTDVLTFGCRLNAYESEVMRGLASKAGLENAVIVNTCAVTAEAERQARQAIRRARRERPDARVIVTGCAAQIDPAGFAAMPEVDEVVGNQEKLHWETYLPGGEKVRVNDIMSVRETAGHLIESFDGRARAFVEVQQGCDHRCTFCIIPFGRGNSRSTPPADIVAQARRLVEAGFREMVLTGVDLTGWGADLPGRPRLGDLVRRILREVPSLPRLRLSSVDPVEIDDVLLRLIAEEERLMPHLHLSAQAGDDMILKRMKRRHQRADVLALAETLARRRPELVLGADLIAGFPTETEEMFQHSLDLVERTGMVHLHVFPYSPRPGTPAARMPQLPKSVIKERAGRLRSLGARQMEVHLRAKVGRRGAVLLETPDSGRDRDFAPVRMTGHGHAPGDIVEVEFTGVVDGSLGARPLHAAAA